MKIDVLELQMIAFRPSFTMQRTGLVRSIALTQSSETGFDCFSSLILLEWESLQCTNQWRIKVEAKLTPRNSFPTKSIVFIRKNSLQKDFLSYLLERIHSKGFSRVKLNYKFVVKKKLNYKFPIYCTEVRN